MYQRITLPVIEAEAFKLTLGFNFNLFRFCVTETRTLGFPVAGLTSIVRYLRAIWAAFLNLILAEKSPVEDAVTFILAAGWAYINKEEAWINFFGNAYHFNTFSLWFQEGKCAME